MRTTLRGIGSSILAAGIAAAGAGGAAAGVIDVTADVTASQTSTSNNEYVLTQVIYVTTGATLTIEPGTVVRGEPESSPGANDPGALVITRGSKTPSLGTEASPIVLTDLLDDNVRGNPGTLPYDTLDNALALTGQWGGQVLLGRGYVASNTLGPERGAGGADRGVTPAGGVWASTATAGTPTTAGRSRTCRSGTGGSTSRRTTRSTG
jgi:hypothetical protein